MSDLGIKTIVCLGSCAVSVILAVLAYTISAPGEAAAQKQPPVFPGSIHSYVAADLSPLIPLAPPPRGAPIRPGDPIFVSDIDVWAKNITTGATSPHVVTNPQGYFQTPELPAGDYQICVSGTGYTTACDTKTISVTRPVVALDHIVLIRPATDAISGTVTLANRATPCFWFRPSVSPQALTAKVSLLDGNGNVVAGPVNGNNWGQYVLPATLGASNLKLHVACDSGVAEIAVAGSGFPVQDVAIVNQAPRILSLDFSKGTTGIRRANPGDTVHVTVQAIDLDGDTLHYSWTDDSGRSLGLPDAPSVDWPLPNLNLLNTIHVQVSDGRGGIVTQSRTLQSGPDAIFFAGRVFNRATNAGISGASVSLNNTVVQTDSAGNFRLSVPDAAQFVLNVSKPGFALASIIYHTRATGIAIPLDAVQTANIDGGTGGTIDFPPPECRCPCPPRRRGKHDYDREGYDKEGHYDKEGYDKGGYKRGDYDEDEHERDGGHPRHCIPLGGTTGSLSVGFPPGALLTSTGLPYTGTASVEGHQYDLTQPNPIPGDLGAVYKGFSVRMGTFGAFHLLARDAQGHPLALAPGKTLSASMPIQSSQLATAPPAIPFFHYDETTGLWAEDGTLTRTGNRYVGQVTHFSVFNADTVFPGGACLKVVLDNSFKVPVTLDASYFDPNAGQFYHNNFQTSDTTIGVERMQPNQNFTLTITDSNGAVVIVPLYSGTGLDPTQFPGGLDTDTVNFSHCHGPVQISNNTIPSPEPNYFLGPAFGGSITDHSADYQKATDAQPGGTRNTLNQWKTVNGFPVDGSPAANEAKAIYWNNGDLKFGRDMHCRQGNFGALACYVSNFGNVGTNDAVNGLKDAENYENSHQSAPAPVATVAMEYDPTKGAGGVQFWAYKGDGTYLAKPVLDSQGAKPMPDMCRACHQGTYTGNPGDTAQGATFLPFDLSSFLDDTAAPFPSSAKVTPAVQEQFRQLNNMVVNTLAPPGTVQLVNLWYPGGVNNANVPFDFTRHAAQLTPPFSDTGVNHDPLYDTVVGAVCRTCHVPIQGLEWNTFSKMSGPAASFIQQLACRGSGTNNQMPHAEVPWIRFWQNSLTSTLDSELNFGGAGCPNQ